VRTRRPKIEIPFDTIDIIIELLAVVALIFMWIYVSIEYAALPDTIASHFNAKGEADGYANKITLWLLPSISTVLYIGIFALNKFPHLHNYMINITESNAFKNYKFSTRTLRMVNFSCVLLFTYIVYVEIQFSKGFINSLGAWFLPLILTLSLILVIVLIIFQKKNK